MPFRRPYWRTWLEPLIKLRKIRWGTAKNLIFLIPAVFLTLSCGGASKSTRVTGVYYQVKAGDTLTKIGRAYHVNPHVLAEVNNIKQLDQLVENTVIFIPDAEQVLEEDAQPPLKPAKGEDSRDKVPAAPALKKAAGDKNGTGSLKSSKEPTRDLAGAPAPKPEPMKNATVSSPPPAKKKTASKPPVQGQSAPGEEGAATPEQILPPKPSVKAKEPGAPVVPSEEISAYDKGRFNWPVKGKVVNRFGLQSNGMYFNHIRIVTRENAPVTAAAPGTVIFSAPLKEFGETVIIKHDQHFATVYTHLSTRLVKTDHRLKKGEQIGLAGKSETKNEGYIHFEIRDHNKSRNPLLFLP
jgi:murein DD-endopeptidase MepM/ murein hydrolase activator NlpD